jgi:hypothetical protein
LWQSDLQAWGDFRALAAPPFSLTFVLIGPNRAIARGSLLLQSCHEPLGLHTPLAVLTDIPI